MIKPSKVKAFITLMTENDAQAQHGFSLLAKREDLLSFFDELNESGFFKASKIEKSGSHEYLKLAAIKSSEANNIEIAKKILNILRELVKNEDTISNQKKENIWIIFARTLSELPLELIDDETINLVGTCLHGNDKYLTDADIGKKLISKLIKSPNKADHSKACSLLNFLTQVYWVENKFTKRLEPKFKINDYCITTLFEELAESIGKSCGKQAADTLIKNLASIIEKENKDIESWVWIPAIENNNQNVIKNESKQILVFAIRDILSAWMNSEEFDSSYLKTLLSSKLDILRRIAIFLINYKYEKIIDILPTLITPDFFDYNHLHEAYHFLNDRYFNMDTEIKKHILKNIENLKYTGKSKNKKLSKIYLQRRFLHAIYNKGLKKADEWFELLKDDDNLGPVNSHPDFYVYMESWQTNDSSPYSTSELIDFANKGVLIDKLNEFREFNELRSPNIRGLIITLENAIKLNPISFIDLNKDFLNANRPYQYGFINGFKNIWDNSRNFLQDSDWNKIWLGLFSYFEELLTPSFWKEKIKDDRDLIPKITWIPPLVADFLRAGMAKDESSFDETLMPRAFNLIQILLNNCPDEADFERYDNDAMTTSINSTKGKAIECLINYSLRASRIQDKQYKDHADAWSSVEKIFNIELSKCQNSNYVFSTLLSSYIENINYLSKDWVKSNFNKIFPKEYLKNINCAIQGLAYSQHVTVDVYKLLRENNIFIFASNSIEIDDQIKKHLYQRIALAYLWGDESIDSDLFSYFFNNNCIDILSIIIRYFWSIQNQNLDDEQIKKIIDFWRKCAHWVKNNSSLELSSFLSDLGILCCHLEEINSEEKEWLLLSAPYIALPSKHNDMDYLRSLHYLSEKSPLAVLEILEKHLNNHQPYHDYGSYYRSTLESLYKKIGTQQRLRINTLCNKFNNIAEMRDLYKEYNPH